MTQHPGTSQGVTVADAATLLGVSTTTVRRMIRRGQLEAQTVIRPQGRAFVVMLPAMADDAAGGDHNTRHSAHDVERTQAPPAGQLAAWSETFLVPLIAALERSQATVKEQAGTIGRLEAELTAERQKSSLEASTAAEAPDLTPEPFWRSLDVRIAGALAVLAIGAVIVLLVVPR